MLKSWRVARLDPEVHVPLPRATNRALDRFHAIPLCIV